MSTLALQISANDDDGHQYNTGLICRLYDTIQTLNGSGDIQGYLFRNVTIPQGSTINSADFIVWAHHAGYDTVVARAYCEATDSPAAMQHGVADDIYNRPRTTAYATIDVSDGSGSTPTWVTLCDMAGAVQEVIDRPGWSSGNDLMVIATDYVSGEFRVQAYDTAGNGAKLEIDYTAPSGGADRARLRLLRQGTRAGRRSGF